jgi:hypothetical protein
MDTHILEKLSRRQIESLIDAAIYRLDVMDGDADMEPEEIDGNGDEHDFTGRENSPFAGMLMGGSGL